jgi:carbonic anhydrase
MKIKISVATAVLLACLVGLVSVRVAAAPETAAPAPPARTGADAILRELLAGNERFASGKSINPRRAPEDFRSVAASQNPSAVVITCADSRVPPELLFDEGVGDLFVIRVAGNVVSGAGPAVKGSIEYAVAELNVPLVIVLGHTGCGAVKSAVKHIDAKDSLPGSINELVELVKPAVLEVRGRPGDLVENAIRANVSLGVDKLMKLQPILGPRVKNGRLKIVGGVYDLSTGKVTMN